MAKIKAHYDRNRDSDSLMLLNVYQEWVHKYHPDLMKFRVEPGQKYKRQVNIRHTYGTSIPL